MIKIITTIKEHIMNVFDFGAIKVGLAIVCGYFVSIFDVPTYADDAAATGGGLTTGQLYQTTSSGSTFLKIVP